MPRCKHCKTKFDSKRFNAKYCLETIECIQEWNEFRKSQEKRIQAKKWSETKKVMREKLETVQSYAQKVQKTFNAYIRKRDEKENCISCGKIINGVRHASHYISAGTHWNVRFNEDNVWVSCYKCNVMLSGNQLEYRKRLIEKIGIERVEFLELEANKTKKFSIQELKEIQAVYKEKLK